MEVILLLLGWCGFATWKWVSLREDLRDSNYQRDQTLVDNKELKTSNRKLAKENGTLKKEIIQRNLERK